MLYNREHFYYMDSFSETDLFGNRLLDGQIILSTIKKVVERYVRCKAIPKRESEDVTMTVVEKIFRQKEKIEHAFDGRSTPATYYTAVINRMCCEVIRKESRSWYAVDEAGNVSVQNNHHTESYEAEKSIILEQEVQRLKCLLCFLNEEREKMLLFLIYYFDIPIDMGDINIYAKKKTKTVYSLLVDSKSKSKEEIFVRLANVVNLVENKNIGKDAVRIWFTKHLNSLIERMNINNTYHNKESIAILLELLHNKERKSLPLKRIFDPK